VPGPVRGRGAVGVGRTGEAGPVVDHGVGRPVLCLRQVAGAAAQVEQVGQFARMRCAERERGCAGGERWGVLVGELVAPWQSQTRVP
jgi:hypothetical protein